jgi:FkbH-like protein
MKNRTIQIDNVFLRVYANDFVKKFRTYNTDKFIVAIKGLNKFITKDEKVLAYLIEELKQNNFTIEIDGNQESINEIDITCKNATKNSSDSFKFQIQCLPSIIELSSKTDISVVGIIIMRIVAQIISKKKILYKAIVLDLDETLWYGTLSELGIDKIKENLQSERGAIFIEFMKFIKSLANELGIFIAICSRNDIKMVESIIKELDDEIFPLKNQIDCIIANNNNKSENIRKIAEQLSILPSSIVFIDDNQIVRDEVKLKLPEVFVPEWTNHNELVTQLIAGCIFERVDYSINSQNRRKQFKIIQTERTQNSLPKLFVKAINDDNHAESIKLYSKSNQFKFSRNDDKFDADAKSLYFEIYKENGENLGICSAITYTNSNDNFYIHNWAISCKYFYIGLEEFILIYIQKIANGRKIFINFQHSEYNQKVRELLEKYSVAFKNNDNNNKIELIISKEIEEKMNNNTNLRKL